MLTIKQYAEQHGITYEAVRRQVNETYRAELRDHVQVMGRVKWLDEYAIKFLDGKRIYTEMASPKADPVETYREQILKLQNDIEEMNNEKVQMNKALIEAQNETIKALQEAKAATETLAAERKATAERVSAEQEQLHVKELETQKLQSELDQAKQEAGRYKKTLFGLYRKV